MTTRRQFLGSIPAAGAAFAISSHFTLEGSTARAEPAAPAAGHFDPKGKAPSSFTKAILEKSRSSLPFADKRDFEELAKGFIAPMPDLKIKADSGHIAWDMERFQFLNEDREFDSIHPSLLRQSRLNNNYGLYEVVPGIYQVRGVDLSDITFVRGKTGWIVFDPLVSAEPVRAAWDLFQKHVGEGRWRFTPGMKVPVDWRCALRMRSRPLQHEVHADGECGAGRWDGFQKLSSRFHFVIPDNSFFELSGFASEVDSHQALQKKEVYLFGALERVALAYVPYK